MTIHIICPHCKGRFDASNMNLTCRLQCPLCEDWIWLEDLEETTLFKEKGR